MKKKTVALILVLTIPCLWIVGYLLYPIPKIEISFVESKETLINPSRGFYVQFDSGDVEDMKELRSEGITLALIAYDIRDYVNRDISSDKLEELKTALHTAQEYGIRVILRTAYGFTSEDQFQDPVNFERLRKHIKQIAPLINDVKESILCVQAGFLGPWGEWHSSNLLSENEIKNTQTRNELLKLLLESLDESIVINVRRPRFLRDAVNAGLNLERLGLHNDALLSTENDMGTYDDPQYSRTMELEWSERKLFKSIHGGEMPQVSDYSEANNAFYEFGLLNISYLNRKYNEEVLNTWKADTIEGDNAYVTISNHLGYRISIKTVVLPQYIRKNRTTKIQVQLQNTGFAAISKGYHLGLVIKGLTETKEYPIDTVDLHDIAGQTAKTINYSFKIPATLTEGDLELGLRISGPISDVPSRHLDSVILANENMSYVEGVNYFAAYQLEKNKLVIKTNHP